MSARICLGKIVAAHGIKGLVKVVCFGENGESLEKYGPLFTSQDGPERVQLRVKNQIKGLFLAEIAGVSDRNAAQALHGTGLYVARESLPAPLDGTYYHADLIGLAAIDESGGSLGRVTAVQNFGAGDLLEIMPDGGRPYLVPFMKDFVGDVDIKEKKIVIILPEGGFPV